MANKLTLFNLALGKLGVSASARITSLTQNHKGRAALDNVYHAQRQRELRRNYWAFAITRRKVRAIATTDLLFLPGQWDVELVNLAHDIVYTTTADPVMGEKTYYIAKADIDPSTDPALEPGQGAINSPGTNYDLYWGPLVASEWDDATQYYKGELIHDGGVVFLALADPTIAVTPADGAEWHQQTSAATEASPYLPPISGSSSAFVKPRDLMRITPYDPQYSSWLRNYLTEGDLIVGAGYEASGTLDLRFVRDETFVSRFDAMFVDALASCLAHETTDEMTQSNVKQATLRDKYKLAIGEARIVNAIESYGSIEPDEDDWVTARSGGGFNNWRSGGI